jgi:hypothetical protein
VEDGSGGRNAGAELAGEGPVTGVTEYSRLHFGTGIQEGGARPLALKPADIVLVWSDGFVGWRIRSVGRSRGEVPTRVNHVMVVVSAEPALVLDLQPPIVRVRSLYEAYGCDDGLTGPRVAIWRLNRLTDAQRLEIAALACERYSARFYGLHKIVLHRMGLGSWCTWDRTPICSNAVGALLEDVAAHRFRHKPGRSLQPDDIDDDVIDVRSRAQYTCVHPFEPLQRPVVMA